MSVRKREVIAKVEVGSGKSGVGVVVHDNPFLPPFPSFSPYITPPWGLSANSIPTGTVTHWLINLEIMSAGPLKNRNLVKLGVQHSRYN